jgi:hypothetical protein
MAFVRRKQVAARVGSILLPRVMSSTVETMNDKESRISISDSDLSSNPRVLVESARWMLRIHTSAILGLRDAKYFLANPTALLFSFTFNAP